MLWIGALHFARYPMPVDSEVMHQVCTFQWSKYPVQGYVPSIAEEYCNRDTQAAYL